MQSDPEPCSRMMLRTISPSAEPGGDRNRDLSGSGDMQVEDHAVEASVQSVKETREAVWQRDSNTRARSLNDPMPDSGKDMNSIVMNEQCEQRIQSFPTELVFIDRKVLRGGFDMLWIESRLRARPDDDESG